MNTQPLETVLVDTRRVSCDGATAIRGGVNYRPAALGHPRVFLEIDERGFVDCGYCDRRFVLKSGPADARSSNAVLVLTPSLVLTDPAPGRRPLSHRA